MCSLFVISGTEMIYKNMIKQNQPRNVSGAEILLERKEDAQIPASCKAFTSWSGHEVGL